jgi:hypothetical protein
MTQSRQCAMCVQKKTKKKNSSEAEGRIYVFKKKGLWGPWSPWNPLCIEKEYFFCQYKYVKMKCMMSESFVKFKKN